jgi:hypothetical protein
MRWPMPVTHSPWGFAILLAWHQVWVLLYYYMEQDSGEGGGRAGRG